MYPFIHTPHIPHYSYYCRRPNTFAEFHGCILAFNSFQEQEKSSLPPLKLPMNMQNERMDNTENLTMNKKNDSRHTDIIDKMPKSNDTQTNSSENNLSQKNLNIINDENSSSVHDEKIASPKKSLESAPSSESSSKESTEAPNLKNEEKEQPINDEIAHDESLQNDKTDESNESNKNNNNEENNKDAETKGDTAMMQNAAGLQAEEVSKMQNDVQQEAPTNPMAPPKPPRLKSESNDDTSDEKESSKEEDEDTSGEKKNEEETQTNNGQTSSSKLDEESKSASLITRKNADAIENSIEKVEEDEHVEKAGEAKTDDAQDDADVVQSPAPRTGDKANFVCALFIKTRSMKRVHTSRFSFCKIIFSFPNSMYLSSRHA